MKKNKKKLEILKRLCLIIDEANVSQAGIARALGTSPALISRWKKGDITPSIESYEKLCKFLKLRFKTEQNYCVTKSKCEVFLLHFIFYVFIYYFIIKII